MKVEAERYRMTEKEKMGRMIRKETENRSEGVIGASFPGYRKPRDEQRGAETLGMCKYVGALCVGN